MALENGGSLRVEKNFVDVELPPDLPDEKMDNRILKVCLGLKRQAEAASGQEQTVVLVTKDILLRIKAQIIGIRAEDFAAEQVSGRDEQYTGRAEAYVPEEQLKDFKKKGIPAQVLYQVDEAGNTSQVFLEENQFVVLKGDQSAKKTLLGRMQGGRVVPLTYKKSKPYG